MVKHTFKTAFTMIELIFAIVVIAIAVVSLPMMMQVNSKGVESNLDEEAIFVASVELTQASTGYWDANSMADINKSNYSRVVNLDGDCNTSTKLRPGHINQPFHRRCIDTTTITTVSNAVGNAKFKTLNDFAHAAQQLYIGDTKAAAGYKKTDYTIALSVASAADKNIKILTAEVKDSSGNIVTKLYTQSANIGEPQYFKRMF